jgi:hypothetical protein
MDLSQKSLVSYATSQNGFSKTAIPKPALGNLIDLSLFAQCSLFKSRSRGTPHEPEIRPICCRWSFPFIDNFDQAHADYLIERDHLPGKKDCRLWSGYAMRS